MNDTKPIPSANTLVVGLSSSALFDTHESDDVYKNSPLSEYVKHQVQRENQPFPKGTAFPLAEVMMRLNGNKKPFEIVVMSKNEPDAGNRVMNSLAHYKFENVRAAFTGGEPIAQYCEALGVTLLLSREPSEVKRAIAGGTAAGLLYDPPSQVNVETDQLRIAFDFDGVLASLESELVYQKSKPDIDVYRKYEVENANIPHQIGPLFPVLKKLIAIKSEMEAARHALFPYNEIPDAKSLALALKVDEALIRKVIQAGAPEKSLFRAADEGRLEAVGFARDNACLIATRVRAFFSPIEIALVTARNPPVEKRLMTSLRSWGLRLDQMFLMGGKDKEPVLKKFRPHIFFDDQKNHTELARNTVAASLVVWPEEQASATTSTNAGNITEAPAAITATTSSPLSVTVISEKDFAATCRSIFRPYTIAIGKKSTQLDDRFLAFIQSNRKRPGVERAAILNRLKKFDISSVAENHTPRLGRDRRDALIEKLDWIANASGDQTQTELKFLNEDQSV